jgi:hypothetical protein
MSWLTFVAVVGAIGIGIAAYMRWGSTGGTVRDALAVIRAGFFILVGLGLVAGGFLWAGVALIAIFVFVGLGAAVNVEDAVRDSIAP